MTALKENCHQQEEEQDQSTLRKVSIGNHHARKVGFGDGARSRVGRVSAERGKGSADSSIIPRDDGKSDTSRVEEGSAVSGDVGFILPVHG